MNTYLVWGCEALDQDETSLGQAYIQEVVRLNPSILAGRPSALVSFFINHTIADETQDHEVRLQRIFSQLPPELGQLSDRRDGAIARGYLLKGARAIMWGRPEDGHRHFTRAAELNAEADESFMQKLTHQLLAYEREFGANVGREVLSNLAPCLEKVGSRGAVRRLKGSYLVNQAFQSYRAGDYADVPAKVVQAIATTPSYLVNRGVLAILLRSAMGMRTS
jgi:hypothetical protein